MLINTIFSFEVIVITIGLSMKREVEKMGYFELNNGVKVPALGFGTYQMPPAITEENVAKAINLGYRSIDTAQNYGNEAEVGAAVNGSGVSRDDLFVTSKTQTSGYKTTLRGIDESLRSAQLDYFDLMIIHWPTIDNSGTYKALEEAYQAGKLRAIGVSNFNSSKVQKLIDRAEVKPMIDQIETDVYWQQNKMHKFLNQNNILHESWAPLGEGLSPVLSEPAIIRIAEKYQKSTAQVILRFLTQQHIMVIPKSTNPVHIAENLNVFDFKLTDDELDIIKSLDQGHSGVNWPSSMGQEAY